MKKFVLLAVIASFFQIAISAAPNPYATAAFYVLQSRGKTEASGILQRITIANSSTLTQLLRDTNVFLGSPAFLEGLSHKYEKPLFEKAVAEGLKQLKYEGITDRQQQEIATLARSFTSTDRAAFINNLTKLGHKNPATFDADYVSPEVLFVKSPTGGRTRYGLTEFLADEATLSPEHRHKHTRHLQEKHARTKTTPSPPSSESYNSPDSSPGLSAPVFADPLPERRTTSRPRAHSSARAKTKSKHPLPQGERRRSTPKPRRTPTPPRAPTRAAPHRKAPHQPPVFAVDLSHDGSEVEMPSEHEIRRALNPWQFYKPTRSSLYSSRRPPSPKIESTLRDFAVNDDFFEVPPPLPSRSSSRASLPAEVGLPSDTESSPRTSPGPIPFSLSTLPPPPPRPVLPLYQYTKTQPAKPASPTHSRRSSSSSSSSRETARKPAPRPGARKPLNSARKRRERPQARTPFLRYTDEAAAILARSEKALRLKQTPAHVPGFVATAE